MRGSSHPAALEWCRILRALIIDDERLARNALRRLLKAHRDVDIVGEASNADEAVHAVRKTSPDIIFLDVEMPGRTGFELLEQLEDVPVVIFTTAYDEYAVRAFEVSALDYLVKPISAERLASSLGRAQKAVAALSTDSITGRMGAGASALHQIFVREGDRCWIVRLADISLLESEGNYTRLHFGGNAPLVCRSLIAIEERLNPATFFRVNRSQIINLSWIQSVEDEIDGRLLLRLRNNKEVGISRRQSKRLRELLSL